jgi:hypothetical protein
VALCYIVAIGSKSRLETGFIRAVEMVVERTRATRAAERPARA